MYNTKCTSVDLPTSLHVPAPLLSVLYVHVYNLPTHEILSKGIKCVIQRYDEQNVLISISICKHAAYSTNAK